MAKGVLFTLGLAALGTALSHLPALETVGAMLTSILLAVIYRNTMGYPEGLKAGIRFSGQKILRFAIVLYGFKLNVQVIIHKGATQLQYDAQSILIAIGGTMLIARLIGAERRLSLLLGIGTGVCGAAAIAAAAPALEADEEETAIGVGIVALVGTLFALTYAFLRSRLPLSPVEYGILSGISLHEIAHVAAAASPAGPEALAEALLAKLGRVFLMVPLVLAISLLKRRPKSPEAPGTPQLPWFLGGFVMTSLMGTYLPIPKGALSVISTGASFLLASAMVGLGLNVHLANFKRALKPMTAMLAASVILSWASYLTIRP
ncbi:MAG: putative sulfate exporter family transporter [Thermanaerothrix sp.]|nr:putative sulfate exporter family transporter [Thermanaerothrix sp.]